MKTTKIINIRIEANENCWLTKDSKTFCKIAYLGINDSVANWREVTKEEKEGLELLAQNEEEL